MSLSKFLSRVLNETIEDDDFFAVTEVYEDDEENDEDEWDEKIHSHNESVKKIRVIRNGIPVTIARSTKSGYKITHGREYRIGLHERRARERAAARTYAAKKRHQSDRQQAQRKESLSKRKDFGLDKEE
jgi:hypothetical protein